MANRALIGHSGTSNRWGGVVGGVAQTSLRHLGTSAADWCLLLKTTLEEAAQIAEQGGEGEKECLDMIALIVAREPAFARALNQAGSPEAVAEALVAAHAVVFCAAHGEEPLQHEEAAGAMLAQPSGAPWLRFVLEGGMLAFADETFAYELETLGAFDQSQGGTGPKHVVVAGSLASLAMHTDDSGVEHRARTLTEVVADLRGGAEFARPTSYLRFGNEARALLRDSAKNREHERVMREALRVTVPFAHWDHDTVTALLECTVLRRVNAQTVIVDAQSRPDKVLLLTKGEVHVISTKRKNLKTFVLGAFDVFHVCSAVAEYRHMHDGDHYPRELVAQTSVEYIELASWAVRAILERDELSCKMLTNLIVSRLNWEKFALSAAFDRKGAFKGLGETEAFCARRDAATKCCAASTRSREVMLSARFDATSFSSASAPRGGREMLAASRLDTSFSSAYAEDPSLSAAAERIMLSSRKQSLDAFPSSVFPGGGGGAGAGEQRSPTPSSRRYSESPSLSSAYGRSPSPTGRPLASQIRRSSASERFVMSQRPSDASISSAADARARRPSANSFSAVEHRVSRRPPETTHRPPETTPTQDYPPSSRRLSANSFSGALDNRARRPSDASFTVDQRSHRPSCNSFSGALLDSRSRLPSDASLTAAALESPPAPRPAPPRRSDSKLFAAQERSAFTAIASERDPSRPAVRRKSAEHVAKANSALVRLNAAIADATEDTVNPRAHHDDRTEASSKDASPQVATRPSSDSFRSRRARSPVPGSTRQLVERPAPPPTVENVIRAALDRLEAAIAEADKPFSNLQEGDKCELPSLLSQ